MKRILLYIVRLMGGRAISRLINVLVRRVATFTHWVQFKIEWGMEP